MTQVLRHARHRQRRQGKTRGLPQLNLVALMDVFTILVFFFLVHSSDMTQSADHDIISLPESVANERPRQTIVIIITKSSILVQGDPVSNNEAALNSSRNEISALRKALLEALGHKRSVPNSSTEIEREVTIMGDKSIPFRLLKKVMVTCTRAGFDRISLSVLQKPSQPG